MKPVLRAALAAVLSVSALAAQEPRDIPIKSYTLPNGLRVHLVEDHSAQVVAVNLWYRVGARDERLGHTGFAHLFEHMMFQGSEHVQKAEHFQFIERAGGTLNGSTQADRTNYWEVLPSNRLNLGLWLEAERMQSLAVTQANLDNQREAVKEERRLRFDNQPYVGALVDSIGLLYDRERCFAYSHSLVGSMADLNAAKVEDVQAFFRQYYAPNNATLVLVGDFNSAEATALIAQYFNQIPAVPAPPSVACDQPYNTGVLRRNVADANATIGAVLAFWRIPAVSHADYPALDLLSTIFGQGESSRLNRTIVREQKVAAISQSVLNPIGPTRGPGIFGVLAIANQGVAVDSVERAVVAQAAQLVSGITEGELAKAKAYRKSTAVSQRQHALGLAEAIQFADLFLGSANRVNDDIRRYDAVTVADLQRVAATYLRPDNSLTLLIVPGGK
ncbi:MAG: pitrilysin family protein [Gemmatimonadetes bacterium]|nr:pitrilysin family protein [Gemmatimonadota bacterium]